MTLQPTLQSPTGFAAIRYYIVTAVIFLDFGILFGGLNALRVAEIFNVPEIHQTHWTSTLIGGMTVIMMGQLFYFIGLSIEVPSWVQRSLVFVLALIILGAASSYIQAWFPGNYFGRYFIDLVKLASLIYLLLVSYVTLRCDRKYRLRDEPAYVMIYAALIWMAIAQLYLFGYSGIIGAAFKITYIYGFFSLTLFGSLTFVLPRLLGTKSRPRGAVLRDTIMVSLSAIFLLVNEFLDSPSTLLGLLGTVFWGLVGFFFILYVFDLIYKTGMTMSLIGLSVALIMFGFFVFDTFMKAVFPRWVNASHAHFMFLGTLVITIISIGLQLIDKELNSLHVQPRIQQVMIALAVILIGIILLSFTLQAFAVAGFAGITLFACLMTLEVLLIFQIV